MPNYLDDDIDQPYKTPSILKESGILFCLDYSGDMPRMGSRNLPFLAGTTVAYGLNREEALQLITLNAAKILGIDDRTGSLETGKDAISTISTVSYKYQNPCLLKMFLISPHINLELIN